ncbi:unnamed protein product [Urochloa decumbens]|uniref:DUF3615 domain-containing protein n=1 Tax=Urochloa decumbens TaxID=240449 RepID=A0ABC8VFR4_9POAL
MLLRSGRATSSTRPRRRSGISTSGGSFKAAAGRPRRLKRNSSGEAEAAPRRSRQPPPSPCCSDSDEASQCQSLNRSLQQHTPASFVYKHALDNGSILAMERDGIYYYHLNFMAEDKKGHSQLFFGEIRLRVGPTVENVTCCCPVSPSDAAGGKSIRTIEEALEFEFPIWGTAGMDQEHCYACPSRVKHPKGTAYVAGHYADSRQYCMFHN